MPGPPPKPHVRRRNRRPPLRVLPAEGRRGHVPRWPIGRCSSPAVREVWRDLWRTPQAVAWAEMGWTRVVARYALLSVAADEPGASIALAAEVRQLEDRLGLSPLSMSRLMWTVGEPPPATFEPPSLSLVDLYGA